MRQKFVQHLHLRLQIPIVYKFLPAEYTKPMVLKAVYGLTRHYYAVVPFTVGNLNWFIVWSIAVRAQQQKNMYVIAFAN